MHVEFPGESGEALKRLCELHPGLTPVQVIARALCFYHVLYEASLEGNSMNWTVEEVLAWLDEMDDKERKQQQGD